MTLPSKMLRCLLACFLALCTGCFSLGLIGTDRADAAPATSQPSDSAAITTYAASVEVAGLYLRAYPVDANMDWTGSRTTTIDGSEYLRLCVGIEWTDGVIVWQKDTTQWDSYPSVSGFTFTIVSGDSVSVPRPDGLIYGTGKNGDTKIKATLVTETGESTEFSATITITATHQESDLSLSNVRIVDDDGEAIGSMGFGLDDLNKTVTLYLKITYKNKTTGEKTTVGNYGGQKLSDSDLAGVMWNEIDNDYASLIPASDGTASFKPIADGSLSLKVTKNHDGDSMSDKVAVSINTGKGVDGNYPSDQLKINIAYEQDTSNIVETHTWSVDEFESLGLVTYKYTLTGSNGRYVTDRARGVTFDVILKKLGVATSDIEYFTFAANDGANPGKMSANWLLRTARYWLPNYDIGGSLQDRKQVPTMLAVADCWLTNEIVTDDAELNSGTRFRLMYGASTRSDGAYEKSLKWINTMTIVLSGAPSSKHGNNNNSGNDKKKDKDTVAQSHNGGSGANGSGGAGGAGTGGTSGFGINGTGASVDPTAMSTGSGDSAAGDAGVGAEANDQADWEELDAMDQWRIYQMMNKNMNDFSPEYEDNPLGPYVAVILAILFVAAIIVRSLRFRRGLFRKGWA